MKAQRRHELQRNALEVEIRKLWEFLRRRGNYLAWGALGIAAVVLAVVWYVKRSGADAEATQAKFVRCLSKQMSPEERFQGLSEVAAKTSHPFWASQATVQLGYDVATTLAARWLEMTDAERTELRREAESYYRKAISDFPKEPLAAAKARYGLAKLAENWGELDQARAEYEGILQDPQVKGQPVFFLAGDALRNLSLLQADVYMPASAPATSPSSGPATGPASGPATGPASGPASVPSLRPAASPATGPSSGPASSRPAGPLESD